MYAIPLTILTVFVAHMLDVTFFVSHLTSVPAVVVRREAEVRLHCGPLAA